MGRFITTPTFHGPVTWHYVLHTPRNHFKLDATRNDLDESVPSVLLLLPAYSPVMSTQPQFADPRLRRFNLLTVDYIARGKTEGSVPDVYGVREHARDLVDFLEALRMPPVIIVGLSLGGMIGLQLAFDRPEMVQGVMMVSTLGGIELPPVAAGRTQIAELWATHMETRAALNASHPETPAPDTALEAVYLGANQLAWGTTGHTPLVRAIATLSFRSSLATWGADKLREARIVTLDVFTKMKPFEREDYARLAGRGGSTRRTPVALVYGTADVAYPEHNYKAFAREMEEEGVKLDVFTLEDAPHFLSATHFEELNYLIEGFTLSSWTGLAVPPAPTPPAGHTKLTTAFDDDLRSAGWKPEWESEEEDEIEMAEVVEVRHDGVEEMERKLQELAV